MMITIAAIFGTRPDTIKMAPVLSALRNHQHEFRVITIATAQHRQMLDQVLDIFKIKVNYDLNIMKPRQSIAHVVMSALEKLDTSFRKIMPDLVLVQGDTSTTFVGSLAAFYHKIPVGHIEAGLRTDDKYRPFPEEINRRLTTSLTDLHFVPTQTARQALLAENVPKEMIFLTGNTVIDALLATVKERHRFRDPFLETLTKECRRLKKRIILITCHRRENWGRPMHDVCVAVKKLSARYPDAVFLFPVHLNPVVREVVFPILGGLDNVVLIEPLEYESFVNLMNQSFIILTDSGGIQEEAPALGKPVLVLREVTERPEAVDAGTARLVGLEEGKILREASRLLDSPAAYRKMARAANPYGDGKATWRIIETLRWYFGFRKRKAPEFQGR
jgi:UDP-N-acetylglucosamine 2-epimerase (non-hydrolysing)